MSLCTQQGFSLAELLIALAVSSVVVTGMYGTLIQQRQVSTQQEQITEARQIARVTMDSMLEEMRDAGFDPGGLAEAGIVAIQDEATAPFFRFTRDLNCNGTLSSSNTVTPAKGVADTRAEDIAYSFDEARQELRRGVYVDKGKKPLGGAQPVASNILQVRFCYLLDEDLQHSPPGPCILAPLDKDLPNIRGIQVTLTARATAPEQSYIDSDPNQNPRDQHYRKATLTSIVRLRNLGVNRGQMPNQPAKILDFDETCALP